MEIKEALKVTSSTPEAIIELSDLQIDDPVLLGDRALTLME